MLMESRRQAFVNPGIKIGVAIPSRPRPLRMSALHVFFYYYFFFRFTNAREQPLEVIADSDRSVFNPLKC